MRVDGAAVERMLDVEQRPLVSVFLPDRLELVKGPPAVRRAHLDQFVAAMWPARVATRRAYAQALAQRNALIAPDPLRRRLARVAGELGCAARAARDRADGGSPAAVDALTSRSPARRGAGARRRRRGRVPAAIASRRRRGARRRAGGANRQRPRARVHGPRPAPRRARHARAAAASCARTAPRVSSASPCSRCCWPSARIAGVPRAAPPLMLLDDVMSELDGDRRQALVELLRAADGQSVITTTELDHVPGAGTRDRAPADRRRPRAHPRRGAWRP